MGEQRFFHDTYNLRKAQFQKLRDCFEGQDAIREGGTTYLPSGPRVGNWPILELIDCGGNLSWHYRCEDQLGTLRGMTDAAGIRVAEFDTSTLERPACGRSSTFASRTGEVYHKHPLWRGSASPNLCSLRELFDGRASRIDSASWEPLSQVTHILLVPGVFFPEDVLGAVLRATNSESAATAVVTNLYDTGNTIAFDDPNGAVADIISNDDGQFLIWDNRQTAYTGYPTTGGTWTNVDLFTDPQFGELTILTSGNELFAEFMVGWQVQVNAAVPVYLDIVTTTGDGICVSGDVSALVTAEETEFCIIHPVGVNPENGATQTDPCQPESRYLWGGGYYLPPIVGFEMWHNFDFGVFGAQPGDNKSGQHYMWNRVYDINMGRWTTPDPADAGNNQIEYVHSPLRLTDPTGLISVMPGMAGDGPEPWDRLRDRIDYDAMHDDMMLWETWEKAAGRRKGRLCKVKGYWGRDEWRWCGADDPREPDYQHRASRWIDSEWEVAARTARYKIDKEEAEERERKRQEELEAYLAEWKAAEQKRKQRGTTCPGGQGTVNILEKCTKWDPHCKINVSLVREFLPLAAQASCDICATLWKLFAVPKPAHMTDLDATAKVTCLACFGAISASAGASAAALVWADKCCLEWD